MNSSEFDIIKKFFTFTHARNDVVLAGGDDCAVVSVEENKHIVITTDTLISGVHFPANTLPEDIAYKSLMVNFSDLAAMGATPAWVTLAISLPEVDETWLTAFSQQFSSVLSYFNVSLIGGDTTKGPLSITIQAMGLCDKEKILRRDRAKTGDKIFVTGYLGDAAIGLHALLNKLNDKKLMPCIKKLNRPEARVKFAQELTLCSDCAIDISDGLVADLGHILKASQCGASIKLSDDLVSLSARYYFHHYYKNTIDWSMVLTQGDDYELCFTINEDDDSDVIALAQKHQLQLSCIGVITASEGLHFTGVNNELIEFSDSGFKHF